MQLTDGDQVCGWQVPALAALFRGTRQPPPSLEGYPAEYLAIFSLVEEHFLKACDVIGDRTDQEMEEIYSTLRRRPDGRSLGAVHDFLWQAAALLLGSFPLSEAEYKAIFGQLARSARHWAQQPVSRNYAAVVRKSLSELESDDS
jgi:hypothetical protein